ncbi:biliverdin-producing heme oxygenase [Arthrobacter sp. 18067]|uniref:biliverdin-producing heme oxygenase n=1 Tax=Arthrobacter sp. 18067 TaxID=2681413 RepID=UPI002E18DD4F
MGAETECRGAACNARRQAYAAQLAALGPTSATYLMAHHYVRYLGDLSGGQIISALVQRHYGLTPEGLNFYAFKEIGKIKPYKDAYRARLDATDFSAAERSEILNYAAEAFETNRQVFVDLMERCSGIGPHVQEPLPG